MSKAMEAALDGMAQADANAEEEWKEAAALAIQGLAFEREFFTSDDVRERLKDSEVTTHNLSALGPQMLKAAKAKLITNFGYQRGRLAVGHANLHILWKSLIYKG